MSSDRSTSEAASHATTSSTSFYELLSLPPEYHPTPTQPIPPPIPAALLRKTYRKTSLLYHPDKNPSPDAAATFHTLTTAYDVLSDAATKQAYDQALVARLVRKRKTEVMDGQRRRLKEELEAREKAAASGGGMGMGWKKQKTGDDDEEDEQEFQRRLAKLKEEGAKLRQKREEALRKAEVEAREEEEEEERKKAAQKTTSTGPSTSNGTNLPSSSSSSISHQQEVPESRFTDLDKTLFLKLHLTPTLPPLTSPSLTDSLSPTFGDITSCLIRHPPPPKSSSSSKKKKEKEPLATAVVQFKSIISAHNLIHTFRSNGFGSGQIQTPEGMDKVLWERIRDVKWAGGKEPDSIGIISASSSPTPNSNQTPMNPPPPPPPLPTSINVIPPTPTDTPTASSAASSTPPYPPPPAPPAPPRFSFRPPPPTPSSTNQPATGFTRPNVSSSDYESITLMRMREMERKLMEAEIRAKEAAMEEAERVVHGGGGA